MTSEAARALVRARWDKAPTITKRCVVCDVAFPAKHPAALYCSDKCTQRARRKRRKERLNPL